jgi:hypothetical protein
VSRHDALTCRFGFAITALLQGGGRGSIPTAPAMNDSGLRFEATDSSQL